MFCPVARASIKWWWHLSTLSAQNHKLYFSLLLSQNNIYTIRVWKSIIWYTIWACALWSYVCFVARHSPKTWVQHFRAIRFGWGGARGVQRDRRPICADGKGDVCPLWSAYTHRDHVYSHYMKRMWEYYAVLVVANRCVAVWLDYSSCLALLCLYVELFVIMHTKQKGLLLSRNYQLFLTKYWTGRTVFTWIFNFHHVYTIYPVSLKPKMFAKAARSNAGMYAVHLIGSTELFLMIQTVFSASLNISYFFFCRT